MSNFNITAIKDFRRVVTSIATFKNALRHDAALLRTVAAKVDVMYIATAESSSRMERHEAPDAISSLLCGRSGRM